MDVFHPKFGARRSEDMLAAAAELAAACAAQGVRVIFESEPDEKSIQWIDFPANGGYDRKLRTAFETAGAEFSRANPRQARNFAWAMGGARQFRPQAPGSMELHCGVSPTDPWHDARGIDAVSRAAGSEKFKTDFPIYFK